jgi:exonuclease III
MTDFIFLSDIRLNSSPVHAERIKKQFLYNGKRSYIMHTNSNLGKRGVAILMAADLPGELYNDEQNLLGVTYDNGVGKIPLAAIYGPNDNEAGRIFFHNLEIYLNRDPLIPVIIGGDWNCTFSLEVTELNIDILRMTSPPSLVRSGWMQEICTRHHLLDPFRALKPDTKDYTYVPRGVRANRSRIDFFLIGEEILNRIKSCEILPYLGSTILDHKSISLTLSIEKTNRKVYISPDIFVKPRTEDVVWAAVADCYLNHAVPGQEPGDRRGRGGRYVLYIKLAK